MPYKDPKKQREYQRLYRANRRAEFFADKYCVVCGTTDRLELDHIDPSTKVDHKIWSWSQVRRDAEIAKCQVLCYTHHKAKTRLEQIVLEHGTWAMYQNHGCQCELCLAKSRDSKRESRARLGRN